jgi:DNA-directed RNA polymerase specialized sigma24 family protein
MYSNTAEQQRRERVQALAEELYRERRQYLLRIATRNAATEADAEEAVQFAFLAFIEKFDPGSVGGHAKLSLRDHRKM